MIRAALGAALGVGLGLAATDAAAQAPPAPDGASARFGFGRAASDAEIARLDIDVRPDGAGLPEGGATARDGAPLYRRRCASCHGAQGEGGTANRLVSTGGAPGLTIGSYWPYATTVFDYVRRAMPTNAPGSLSDQEVYAVTAWLLARNGLIGDDDAMTADTLPGVTMPARDRFVPDDRLETTDVR